MITINKAQRLAVKRQYDKNPDGAPSYRQFRKRVVSGFNNDYIMIEWGGMYVGIEKDGYAHT